MSLGKNQPVAEPLTAISSGSLTMIITPSMISGWPASIIARRFLPSCEHCAAMGDELVVRVRSGRR